MNTYSTTRRRSETKVPRLTLHALHRHLEGATEKLRSQVNSSEYKVYLLGLLFLKQVSDQFEERYGQVHALWMSREKSQEEARVYAEDSRNYPCDLFVPKAARWSELHTRVKARDNVAAILNEALRLLAHQNEALSDVLSSIDFERRVGRGPISDQTLRDLIEHFSTLHLAGDGLGPDLLGTAYDRLVRDYASSGGRGDGEFYTPPELAHLLVRLLKPCENFRIYDPSVGSGGLLLESARHIKEMGGDPNRASFYGQDIHPGTRALCIMNMLLHGIGSAHIENGDTLLHPRPLEADGTLTTFDRIIANPPFSGSYTTAGMEFVERFHFYCPQNGKQSEYMFVQHMLAVLRPGGMIASVLPHGVLFRGGSELANRRWLIQELDAIEGVIGLPPGLFYGTAIPTCILILRSQGTKPDERKGKVLFINAEEEYGARRGQNYLRPQDEEKIASCVETFREVAGYSRIVGQEELEENFWNLTVRRYIEPVPIPPPDVRGLLLGRVSKWEVAAKQEIFDGFGLPITAVLTPSDTKYYQFMSNIGNPHQIRTLVTEHAGVQEKMERAEEAVRAWWCNEGHAVRGTKRTRAELREHLKVTFTRAVVPEGTLNEMQAAGVFACWWETHRNDWLLLSMVDVRVLVEGWASSLVVQGELDTIPPLLKDLVQPEVEQIRSAQRRILDLEQLLLVWQTEQDEDGEDLDEAQEQHLPRDRASELQKRLGVLKSMIKERLRVDRESTLETRRAGATGTRTGYVGAGSGATLPQLDAQRVRCEQELTPYLENKTLLVKTRKHLKTLLDALSPRLQSAINQLCPDEVERIALGVLGADIVEHLHNALATQREELIGTIVQWFERYAEGIVQLQEKSKAAEVHLQEILTGLGYFQSSGNGSGAVPPDRGEPSGTREKTGEVGCTE